MRRKNYSSMTWYFTMNIKWFRGKRKRIEFQSKCKYRSWSFKWLEGQDQTQTGYRFVSSTWKKEPGIFSFATCEVKMGAWREWIISAVLTPFISICLLKHFLHMAYGNTFTSRNLLYLSAATSEHPWLLPPCKKFQGTHYQRIPFVQQKKSCLENV